MVDRVWDWYAGLSNRRKLLVFLFAALGIFATSYLVTLWVLSLRANDGGSSPTGSAPQESFATPGSTSPDETTSAFPELAVKLRITDARWEGEKAIVQGLWKGDLSSVHCDLLEGGGAGRAIDWWDRSIPSVMSWSQRTFSQEFIETSNRRMEDPINPDSRYTVACWAQFSDGVTTGDDAPVEGSFAS